MEPVTDNNRTLTTVYTVAWAVILILLVIAAISVVLSGADSAANPGELPKLMVRVYLLTLPIAIGVFSVVACFSRQKASGIAGAVLTLIWLILVLV